MERSTIRLVGDQRQPQHDSYGRKVPIWEAVEVEQQQELREGKENQSFFNPWSWRKAPSVASSQSTQIGIPYGGKSLKKEASWVSWFSRSTSWKSFTSTEKNDQISPASGQLSTSWKPASLKLPVLGSVFVVTLVLIVGLEILSQISMNNGNGGGLVFAKTVDDIPMGYTFIYLYLPTVIAVIYSMTWSWIDLDTKRLEPWFQLSKPEGASAEHSILLQYPFDFLALVPIKAARRSHWAIVIAGATMVFITWAIVPLQSAIFATDIVNRTLQSQMVTTGRLMSPADQALSLNTNFMNRAYGVSWLDQKLPSFATKEYSLIPFAPTDRKIEMFADETWTATTQMFFTNLTCKPAKFKRERSQHSWQFESDDGCRINEMNLLAPKADGADYIIHYIQYFDDAQVARALQNPSCTREHSNKFLAIWGERTNYTGQDGKQYPEWNNLTALFCETEYYRRNITATVAASDMSVVGVEYDYKALPEKIGEDIFNATHLHYTSGTGVTSIPSKDDLPNINVLEQYPRILNSSLQWPISSMTGFGLAMRDQELASFSDPAVIQTTFDRAHKLLFSMAVTFSTLNVTGNDNMELEVRMGSLQDKPGSIVLERVFALVVEVCLGLVALLTAALWLYYKRRTSNLVSDPASVSDIMALVRSSRKLLHDFNDNGTVTAAVLAERLKGQRFRLNTSAENGHPDMKLEAAGLDCGFDENKLEATKRTQTVIDCPEQYKSVRPLEMKLFTGALLSLVVAGAISTVVVLYVSILKHNGLQRPSENSIVLLILTNLVPTAFATLIEPFWVVLNRLLCILQPFEDLRNGNAKSAATVRAKYTATPPQLALWRALQSGHYVLALVCFVAMSTNLLAIALSGLFEESPTRSLSPVTMTSSFSPTFIGNLSLMPGQPQDGFIITYLDHYYVHLANTTVNGGAPLPAWIDNQYFYLPFDLPGLSIRDQKARDMKLEGYEATTRGFGLEVECQEVFEEATPDSSDTFLFLTRLSGSRMLLGLDHTEEDGSITRCWPESPFFRDGVVGGKNWTGEAQSIEFVTPMFRKGEEAFTRSSHYCNSLLLAGWVRAPAHTPDDIQTTPPGSNRTLPELDLDYSFMTCKPSFTTAMFDIRVDATGRVLSSNRSSELNVDLSSIAPPESLVSILQQSTDAVAPTNARSTNWHNDTLTTDWLNSLLKAHLNSSNLIDPSTPAPNITTMIPLLEDMFQRLFPVSMLANLDVFAKEPIPVAIEGRVISVETRIFMSPVMFWMTVSLLALQLVAAFAYYAYRPRRFLPRMPLTIASVLAYVSASHAVHDSNGSGPEMKAVRYGYGRFIGVDGQSHVGIEKEPLVVPLKADNPDSKKRRRSRWLRSKQDPAEPKIWI